MKSIHNSERGFSLIAIMLVLAIIVVIGVVAYRVRSNTSSSSIANQPPVVTSPKTIQSKANLKTANQSLQTAPIGSDLDPTQLDSTVKSLL